MQSEEKIRNIYKFTGEQYDQVTGQYYLKARYYNPVIGRFTQMDTYLGDGLNLYAYVQNNPVRYVDPSGHCKVCAKGNGVSKKTIVTHRGTNENIAQKIRQGYLPANYPNPNNVVTRALDHSKPAVWVSEGKPNWFNRIFSGMIGKRGEASITFEVDSNLLKKPDGLIKRFFGKAQRVVEGDLPIPDDVIIKWGGRK